MNIRPSLLYNDLFEFKMTVDRYRQTKAHTKKYKNKHMEDDKENAPANSIIAVTATFTYQGYDYTRREGKPLKHDPTAFRTWYRYIPSTTCLLPLPTNFFLITDANATDLQNFALPN